MDDSMCRIVYRNAIGDRCAATYHALPRRMSFQHEEVFMTQELVSKIVSIKNYDSI
jgi:hypothetical protein